MAVHRKPRVLIMHVEAFTRQFRNASVWVGAQEKQVATVHGSPPGSSILNEKRTWLTPGMARTIAPTDCCSVPLATRPVSVTTPRRASTVMPAAYTSEALASAASTRAFKTSSPVVVLACRAAHPNAPVTDVTASATHTTAATTALQDDDDLST